MFIEQLLCDIGIIVNKLIKFLSSWSLHSSSEERQKTNTYIMKQHIVVHAHKKNKVGEREEEGGLLQTEWSGKASLRRTLNEVRLEERRELHK